MFLIILIRNFLSQHKDEYFCLSYIYRFRIIFRRGAGRLAPEGSALDGLGRRQARARKIGFISAGADRAGAGGELGRLRPSLALLRAPLHAPAS